MAHDRVLLDPQPYRRAPDGRAPDGRAGVKSSGRKVLTLRSAAPVTPAPADAAVHWHGGHYLGAAPPAGARFELSRGGWGTRSDDNVVRAKDTERCRRDR